MQSLQVFQFTAGVFQLYVHLAKLVGQQSCEIGHCKITEQVNENDRLKRFELGMGSRV